MFFLYEMRILIIVVIALVIVLWIVWRNKRGVIRDERNKGKEKGVVKGGAFGNYSSTRFVWTEFYMYPLADDIKEQIPAVVCDEPEYVAKLGVKSMERMKDNQEQVIFDNNMTLKQIRDLMCGELQMHIENLTGVIEGMLHFHIEWTPHDKLVFGNTLEDKGTYNYVNTVNGLFEPFAHLLCLFGPDFLDTIDGIPFRSMISDSNFQTNFKEKLPYASSTLANQLGLNCEFGIFNKDMCISYATFVLHAVEIYDDFIKDTNKFTRFAMLLGGEINERNKTTHVKTKTLINFVESIDKYRVVPMTPNMYISCLKRSKDKGASTEIYKIYRKNESEFQDYALNNRINLRKYLNDCEICEHISNDENFVDTITENIIIPFTNNNQIEAIITSELSKLALPVDELHTEIINWYIQNGVNYDILYILSNGINNPNTIFEIMENVRDYIRNYDEAPPDYTNWIVSFFAFYTFIGEQINYDYAVELMQYSRPDIINALYTYLTRIRIIISHYENGEIDEDLESFISHTVFNDDDKNIILARMRELTDEIKTKLEQNIENNERLGIFAMSLNKIDKLNTKFILYIPNDERLNIMFESTMNMTYDSIDDVLTNNIILYDFLHSEYTDNDLTEEENIDEKIVSARIEKYSQCKNLFEPSKLYIYGSYDKIHNALISAVLTDDNFSTADELMANYYSNYLYIDDD